MTEPTAITSIRKPPAEAIRQLERVVLQGDLASLKETERVAYYARVCESLGLNPLTRPFEYITLNGKLTLYVRKDATDQLRDLHGVSIPQLERERDNELGLFTVIAHAQDRFGRQDSGMGVVSISGLKGEALANAMMKAETKAKRRATLSIVGLGWMDEVEALDQRAIEVAPRAALAGGIAARTAALQTGSSEASAEGVSSDGEASSVAASPSASVLPPPPVCAHRPKAREARPEGLLCTDCGELLSSYDGDEGPPVAAPAKAARRPRKAAGEPKKAGEDGYGSARAHAIAAERGMDHDAVHRIAADIVSASSTTAVDLGAFSVANLDEPTWQHIIAAISDAPIVSNEIEAANYAGSQALLAGMGDGENPWSEADPAAAAMFGAEVADQLTTAQWLEFGIRVAVGIEA